MRNIVTVADQMKEYIDCQSTIKEIDRIILGANFVAPELMYVRWNELHEVMINYVSSDETKWNENDLTIVSIFTDRTKEDLINEIKEWN